MLPRVNHNATEHEIGPVHLRRVPVDRSVQPGSQISLRMTMPRDAALTRRRISSLPHVNDLDRVGHDRTPAASKAGTSESINAIRRPDQPSRRRTAEGSAGLDLDSLMHDPGPGQRVRVLEDPARVVEDRRSGIAAPGGTGPAGRAESAAGTTI